MAIFIKRVLLILAVLISQAGSAAIQDVGEPKRVSVNTQWQLDTVGAEVPVYLDILCHQDWNSIKLPPKLLASGRLISVRFLGFTSEFNQVVVHDSRLLENTDLYFGGKGMRDYRVGIFVYHRYDINDSNYYTLNLEGITICRYLVISGYDSLSLRSRINCKTVDIHIPTFLDYIDSSVFKNLFKDQVCGGITLRCYHDSINTISDANWLKYIKLINFNLSPDHHDYFQRPVTEPFAYSENNDTGAYCAGFALYTNNPDNFDRFFKEVVIDFLEDTLLSYVYYKTDLTHLAFIFERPANGNQDRQSPRPVSLFLSHPPDSIIHYFLLASERRNESLLFVSVYKVPLESIKDFNLKLHETVIIIHPANCDPKYKRKIRRYNSRRHPEIKVYCSHEYFGEFNNLAF